MSNLLLRWKAAEPVRLYLYSVLVPIVLALVAHGVVDQELGVWLQTIGAAGLGVMGVEFARASVVAPLSLAMPDAERTAVAAVDSIPGTVVLDAFRRDYEGKHRHPQQDAA